jgi:plasmid stabilization system protein ParE
VRRIEWTDDAVANLDAIADYISAFDPAMPRRSTRLSVPCKGPAGGDPDWRGAHRGDRAVLARSCGARLGNALRHDYDRINLHTISTTETDSLRSLRMDCAAGLATGK